MELFTAVELRRSPARLTEPGPTAAQLRKFLEAAVHAPDHGRLSPWRFCILQGSRRSVLADALEALLRRRQPDASDDMVVAERAKAERAPVIVVVAARVVAGHKVPEVEQILAVGAAIQNLLLSATASGFASMWKTGAPAYDAGVKAALGFESTDQIAGFVYLGTAAAAAKPREFVLDNWVRHL